MRTKRHTLANALRIAAERYDADALVAITPLPDHPDPLTRLADQFKHQAKEARELADAIEGGGHEDHVGGLVMARKFTYRDHSYSLPMDDHGRYISTIYAPDGNPVSTTTQHRMVETFSEVVAYCEDYIDRRIEQCA